MWSVIDQGPAMAILDFTSDFAVVFIGLIGMVGLSVAMILWAAIRHATAPTVQTTADVLAPSVEQKEAA